MNYTETFAVKQTQVSNLIQATISAILNISFDTAVDNNERQAVIEVAQDFDYFDLALVLIERYEIMNKR